MLRYRSRKAGIQSRKTKYLIVPPPACEWQVTLLSIYSAALALHTSAITYFRESRCSSANNSHRNSAAPFALEDPCGKLAEVLGQPAQLNHLELRVAKAELLFAMGGKRKSHPGNRAAFSFKGE